MYCVCMFAWHAGAKDADHKKKRRKENSSEKAPHSETVTELMAAEAGLACAEASYTPNESANDLNAEAGADHLSDSVSAEVSGPPADLAAETAAETSLAADLWLMGDGCLHLWHLAAAASTAHPSAVPVSKATEEKSSKTAPASTVPATSLPLAAIPASGNGALPDPQTSVLKQVRHQQQVGSCLQGLLQKMVDVTACDPEQSSQQTSHLA